MGSDRARVSYDPKQQYRSVVMQQGRVTLEADCYEAQQITAEEIRREALDFVGPCGTPDNGYQIVLSTAPSSPPFDFSVGAGSMYVGGMRAHLSSSVDYGNQSDWRDYGPEDPDWVAFSTLAKSPPSDEFVYLYLREQEISAVEDADLKDVALGGPDTAQRTRLLQRMVRVACSGTDCASGLAAAQTKWQSEGLFFDPATMRLHTWSTLEVGFSDQAPAANPCQPQAQGGYVGADNQLIRVQISGIDAASGDPKFLWGFDDASFLYRIEIDSGNSQQLDLQTVPVDAEHQPASNDAVEVLRTAAELSNGANVAATSGYVITLTQNYDPDTQSIQIPAGYSLPADYTTSNQSPPEQLFLRVWEQEVIFTPGQPSPLGNTGLTVKLQTSGNQPFHTGDYWLFAVRTATPQTVYPERYLNGFQAPDGPRLWACPLGVIAWSGQIGTLASDCRNQFCTLVAACKKQQGCCTIVVSPQDLTRDITLQSIVDQAASPTMFVEAATSGAAGNNITVQISNVQVNASPSAFDLTVMETDVYEGLTTSTIESIVGDRGGPGTGLAHILTGSVNTALVPGNDQVVAFSGGAGVAAGGTAAQGDVTDGNQNVVFTLQARNQGTGGNLTKALISNLSGDTFNLTLVWTNTLSAITMATLFPNIQNSMGYLIRAIPPRAVASAFPTDGIVRLAGGADPAPSSTLAFVPGVLDTGVAARAGVFGNAGKICLRPGAYYLSKPLELREEHSHITIESCGGTATLAAAQGAGDGLGLLQGLVTLKAADDVTLCGLRISLPPQIHLAASPNFLSGVNPQAIESAIAIASGLNAEILPAYFLRIYVSVGLRIVGCAGLQVQNCSFYFQNETLTSEVTALLEAGILASGANRGLSLLDNCFYGQRNPTPVSDHVLQVRVGYLLGPSVTFSDVSLLARERDEEIGITHPLPSAAHEEGTLLPALLQDASFQGNTFLGLEIPVLIFSECGAIAFESNTVKDCYSGLWTIARRSPPNPDTVGWEPPSDVNQDPMLEAALALAQSFPLPPGSDLRNSVTIESATVVLSSPSGQSAFLNVLGALMELQFGLVSVGSQLISTKELHLSLLAVNNRIATYQPSAVEDSTGPGLLIWGEDTDLNTEIIVNSNRIENCSQPFVPTAVIVQVETCSITGNLMLNDSDSTAAGSLFVVSLPPTAIAVTGNVFNANTNLIARWAALNGP